MIQLVGINSEVEGRTFPLDEETILVGRDNTNHIQLNDVSVSTMHCMIVSDEATGAYIKDAGSTNGTRINTLDIEEGALTPGDTLEIGNVLFEVQLVGHPTVKQGGPAPESAENEAPGPAEEASVPNEEAPTPERRTRSMPKISIPDWAYALIFTVLVLITLSFVISAVRMLFS